MNDLLALERNGLNILEQWITLFYSPNILKKLENNPFNIIELLPLWKKKIQFLEMLSHDSALETPTIKIVYWGFPFCGKLTNVEVIYNILQKAQIETGEISVVKLKGDLFLYLNFSLKPKDIKNEMKKYLEAPLIRVHLALERGPSYYESVRHYTLQDANGVVFVVDSLDSRLESNQEYFQLLDKTFLECGMDPTSVPVVLQYNKRDFPNAMPVELMNNEFNKQGLPFFESIAATGEGVVPTLKKIIQLVLQKQQIREIFRLANN
ncbi:ADP-ribosylation factor-like protein [Candidatus Uabimicrobium sp. HlEnr_7]|uniref:ADP-ribosylation factor-like protein n=1 Tax=Candidatus Uabimicrobium helgolandensis TaxID=3095367 RepID=UPI003558B837